MRISLNPPLTREGEASSSDDFGSANLISQLVPSPLTGRDLAEPEVCHFSWNSILFVLRRNRFALAFQRCHYSVPGEDRAFDPRREFVHTGENSELAHITFDLAGRHHFMDLIEHFPDVGPALAFGMFGQKRRGSLGDTAAGTDETDILDDIALDSEKEVQLIAAEWVMPLRGAGRTGQLVEIARFLAMVEDDRLIKIV